MADSTETLEEVAKPLDCSKQLLLLAEKHPESKANLLEIAQSFAKQLRACAMKSVGASGAVVKEKIEPGQGWCLLPKQSFQTPRGQFDVELRTDGGVYLHSKSVTHTLKPGRIERIVELKTADKYTSGSASKVQLLFVLKEPLRVNKSTYSCLLCTPSVDNKTKLLSVTLFKAPPQGKLETVENVAQGGAMEMWTTVLSHMSSPIPITEPDGKAFKSSTSGPYVKCYCNNVNNGMLFPMQLGVIFIQKPLVFVPLEKIDRIELGRGGAVSGRTFDLNLYCKDETVHRFSMIEKDELTPLATYVSETKANEAANTGSSNSDDADGEEAAGDGSGEDSAYSEEESLSSASDASDDIDSEDIDLSADSPVDQKIERRTTRAMMKGPKSSSSKDSIPAASKSKAVVKNEDRKPSPAMASKAKGQAATASKTEDTETLKSGVERQSVSVKTESVKTETIKTESTKNAPIKKEPVRADSSKRALPAETSSQVLKDENSAMPKVKKAKVAVTAPANDHTDTESEGENVYT